MERQTTTETETMKKQFNSKKMYIEALKAVVRANGSTWHYADPSIKFIAFKPNSYKSLDENLKAMKAFCKTIGTDENPNQIRAEVSEQIADRAYCKTKDYKTDIETNCWKGGSAFLDIVANS
jgi:hypothetical protein